MFLKPFKFKVFFKLSKKTTCSFVETPIVLLLGVFEKVENCFGWLTKTINYFVISIDCLFENMFC